MCQQSVLFSLKYSCQCLRLIPGSSRLLQNVCPPQDKDRPFTFTIQMSTRQPHYNSQTILLSTSRAIQPLPSEQDSTVNVRFKHTHAQASPPELVQLRIAITIRAKGAPRAKIEIKLQGLLRHYRQPKATIEGSRRLKPEYLV